MLARISVPRSTAAAVSSQDVSIPKMDNGLTWEGIICWRLLFRQARQGAQRLEVRGRDLQAALICCACLGVVSQVLVDRALQAGSFSEPGPIARGKQQLSLAEKRYRLFVFMASEGDTTKEVIAVRLERSNDYGAFELLARAIEVCLVQ